MEYLIERRFVWQGGFFTASCFRKKHWADIHSGYMSYCKYFPPGFLYIIWGHKWYGYENRGFYAAYFGSWDNAYISQSMMDTYFKENFAHYTKAGLDEESMKYLMTFFSAGLKAIALRWLKGGCKQSSVDMVSLIHRAFFMSYN